MCLLITDTCSGNFSHFYNNSHYLIERTSKTIWSNVLDRCFQLGSKVHPVTIETIQEQEHIRSMASEIGTSLIVVKHVKHADIVEELGFARYILPLIQV